MPVEYTKTGGQGHKYQVPGYAEAADGPKAFKDFADYLDLILPPVGSIMPYVGTAAPTGWLLCDGTAYASSSYEKLSAVCGSKFNPPPPATTPAGNFRVPDLRGRTIVGLNASDVSGDYDTIGKSQGTKTVTLTTANMPSHNHAATNLSLSSLVAQNGGTPTTGGDHGHTLTGTVGGTGGHGHGVSIGSRVVSITTDNSPPFERGTGTNISRVNSVTATTNSATGTTTSLFGETDGGHSHTFSGTAANSGGHTHTISGTISGNVDNTGSGTAFSVVNPYITLNYIIRAV